MKTRNRRTKMKALLILAGSLLSTSVFADNETCVDCLQAKPFFQSTVVIPFPVAVEDRGPYAESSTESGRLANVAGVLNRTRTPMFPARQGPAVDPTAVSLPGAFDMNSVDPTFRSEYTGWNAPNYNEWLPKVWNAPGVSMPSSHVLSEARPMNPAAVLAPFPAAPMQFTPFWN
jgi:hypothetical protein